MVVPSRMVASGLHALGTASSSFDWLVNPPAALAQRTAVGVGCTGQLRLAVPGGGDACGTVDLAVNVTEGNGYLFRINGATLRALVRP